MNGQRHTKPSSQVRLGNRDERRLSVLRRRAERSLHRSKRYRPSATVSIRHDVENLLHEVEVHRVELEMQCEQLQESQLEAELNRRRYQELYEAVPIGYATIDVGGKIHDVNPAGLALLNIDSSRRLHNFHSFISAEDVDRFLLACREVSRQQHPLAGELMLVQANGVQLEAAFEIHPARGKSSTLRVIFQDISFRKHNMDLFRRLKFVEDGVIDLTHQVKAPAGRLTEFATWIERDYGQLLDEKGLRYLGWIKDESQDLAMLADGILALASIDQQAAPLETIDVKYAIKEIVSRIQLSPSVQRVVVNVATDFPRIFCRRLHVKQVFQNLIENAFKYMGPQAEPRLDIGWRRKNDSGIQFYVRDNGVGIERSMIDKIFIPFVRLNTVEVAGSGIGLSIVKKVLAAYGESIVVESTPGVGTTFYFRFPLCSARCSERRAVVGPGVRTAA